MATRLRHVIALCFLPPRPLGQVQQALPPPNRVSGSATWDEFLARVNAQRCDVAIVDPTAASDQTAASRIRALGAAGGGQTFAVIGYVSVTAAGIRAVQALVQLGATEIIIRGVDDTQEQLTAAIFRGASAFSANGLVSELRDRSACMPSALVTAVELLFRHPEQFRCVADLASAAAISRRTLDRALARASVAPARTLLACARANAAFDLIAAGHTQSARVAALLGYPSARSLTRDLRSVTGGEGWTNCVRLSRQAFTALVRRRLRRRAASLVRADSY